MQGREGTSNGFQLSCLIFAQYRKLRQNGINRLFKLRITPDEIVLFRLRRQPEQRYQTF